MKRINVRATEIETFDRATLIVPNSTLITGTVKNWVHSDRVGRIIVTISPHVGVIRKECATFFLRRRARRKAFCEYPRRK